MDIHYIHLLATEIREVFREIPEEPFRGAKQCFPKAWCEWASIAVLEALSREGLGDGWIFVTAGLPDDISGHAWLELIDSEGICTHSIDITLDQFEDWKEPYVGAGTSPAKTKFTVSRYSGNWRNWQFAKDQDIYDVYSQIVMEYLIAKGKLKPNKC